ncbi:MAG: lysine--tRNA ligase, partial [Candidatus Woykebacteria bacterium RBG_13_40_7b]
PAKWAALGVTVEGEGKDHASKGGSRDTANAISKEIFNYDPPYDIPYEHFLISGQKMSSSKGVGVSAVEMAEILPPEVLRFLMVQSRPMQHIDFNPEIPHTILKLFDDFDTARDSKDPDLKRIYELSMVDQKSRNYFVPRFRDLVNLIQMPQVRGQGLGVKNQLIKEVERLKGGKLTEGDEKALEERVKYVRIWLEKFAPEETKFSVKKDLPLEAKDLTEKQREFLTSVAQYVEERDPEKFQNILYDESKKLNLTSEDAFKAIYLAFLGKDHGPKAAWLILSLDENFVKKRVQEVVK